MPSIDWSWIAGIAECVAVAAVVFVAAPMLIGRLLRRARERDERTLHMRAADRDVAFQSLAALARRRPWADQLAADEPGIQVEQPHPRERLEHRRARLSHDEDAA